MRRGRERVGRVGNSSRYGQGWEGRESQAGKDLGGGLGLYTDEARRGVDGNGCFAMVMARMARGERVAMGLNIRVKVGE